jgi:hypothetical protein
MHQHQRGGRGARRVVFCSDADHGALPLADRLVIRIGKRRCGVMG